MLQRRGIAVRGIVQGVGFRPFVFGLASSLTLHGFIQNDTDGVLIEVEGEGAILDRFEAELRASPPPLARIDAFSTRALSPRGDVRFQIEPSRRSAEAHVCISPDVALCEQCLAELFCSTDRRYRYPFITCAHCGPRLTIVTGAPYDRQRTTLAGFTMCGACRAEYEDPADRRFHAQPIACPECGPRLRATDRCGNASAGDPLAVAVAALRAGQIVAIKGLGGYHLACNAANGASLATLRRRKHRDQKPFALMVRDADGAAAICEVSAQERALLLSAGAPIVLLRRRVDVPEQAVAPHANVAPGSPQLGVMLPYTPLHHLLLHDMEGVPLVMTSGNHSDEPTVYEDEHALARLGSIADLFLLHDRDIHVRADDSVVRIIDRIEAPIRRSRGYAPAPVPLQMACPCPMLAVGGQLKNTFALGRDRQAFVSHHVGDLDDYRAYQTFVRDITLYRQLFAIEPQAIACDLHPDYASTRFALEYPGVLTSAVQHHHAHIASCMAEHQLTEAVIGVAFDGTGYGPDGSIWGGEFFVGDAYDVRRAAHLRSVALPGGDSAIRHPWRTTVAHLIDASEDPRAQPFGDRLSPVDLEVIERMIARRINAPLSSSAGRFFDAVAGLAGGRQSVTFEGQAAIELEWLASAIPPDRSFPFDLEDSGGCLVVDTRPVIKAAAFDGRAGVPAPVVARRFHSTIVEIIAAVCRELRQRNGLGAVALSGGVFLNEILTREVVRRLTAEGFRVFRHRVVPPSDAGLSLGQLAVAAARLSRAGGAEGLDTRQSQPRTRQPLESQSSIEPPSIRQSPRPIR